MQLPVGRSGCFGVGRDVFTLEDVFVEFFLDRFFKFMKLKCIGFHSQEGLQLLLFWFEPLILFIFLIERLDVAHCMVIPFFLEIFEFFFVVYQARNYWDLAQGGCQIILFLSFSVFRILIILLILAFSATYNAILLITIRLI